MTSNKQTNRNDIRVFETKPTLSFGFVVLLSFTFITACQSSEEPDKTNETGSEDDVCLVPIGEEGEGCPEGPSETPEALTTETQNGLQITRNIHYATRGGRALVLDLFLPSDILPGTQSIVLIHGGGWDDCNNRRRGLEGLAKNYAAFWKVPVWNIQYRMVKEGGAFPENLKDVTCALSYIRANAATYSASADRVLVMGASAGAHLAMMTAAAEVDERLQSDCGPMPDIASVVSFSGPSDMFEMNERSVASGSSRALVGECQGPIDLCSAGDSCSNCVVGSPLAHACNMESDFVLLYADDPFDPLVPVVHAQSFGNALMNTANIVDTVIVESELLEERGCLPYVPGEGFDNIAHGTSPCIADSGSTEIAEHLARHILP